MQIQKGSKNEFLKKYGYYIVLVISIIALAVIVTLATKPQEPENVEVNGPVGIEFGAPVLNANILKNYSASELQYNKTLNQWEAHFAIDFAGVKGDSVLSVYDGTVAKVSSSKLDGTVIEIDHGNNLKTIYKSLDSEVAVKEGDIVKKGDIIGKISDSQSTETLDGSHLHFEVWKDGSQVDPNSYLSLGAK